MAALRILHFLSPIAVVSGFSGAQAFSLLRVSQHVDHETKKHDDSIKLKVALRLLQLLVALTFVGEGIFVGLTSWRKSKVVLPPQDEFMYLVGSAVIWTLLSGVGVAPWHRFSVAALATLPPEIGIAVLTRRVPTAFGFQVSRLALLSSILVVASIASRSTRAQTDEETRPLLGEESNGVNGSGGANGTSHTGEVSLSTLSSES